MKTPLKLKKQRWKKEFTYIHVLTDRIKIANKFRKQAIEGEISVQQALLMMPKALTAKTTTSNEYGTTIVIKHPETGEELGRFEHTPFNPYTCGAQIVFKTKMKVEVLK